MQINISLLRGSTRSPTLDRKMAEKNRRMANRMGRENHTRNGGPDLIYIVKV
jgi:hypothetical protein